MIIRNRAQCLKCGDIIESHHVHDFVKCKCGNLSVDGGKEYCKRNFMDYSMILDMSVIEEDNCDG